MKAISKTNFQIVLQAAVILTNAQERKDERSVDVAFMLWRYIDSCRKKHTYLKRVYL